MVKSIFKWTIIVVLLFGLMTLALEFGTGMYHKLLTYSKTVHSTPDTIDFINRPGNKTLIYCLCLGIFFILSIIAINEKFKTKRVSKTMKILIIATILIGLGSLFSTAYSYINITNEGIYVRTPLMIERYYKFEDVKEIKIDFDRSKKSKPKNTYIYDRYKYEYDYSIKLSLWNTINLSKGTKDYDLSENKASLRMSSPIKSTELPSINKIHRILVDQYNVPVTIYNRQFYDEIMSGEIFTTREQENSLRDMVENN